MTAPAGQPAAPGPALRTRLALLYAGLFLVTGVVLVVIADIPVLKGGQTAPAPAAHRTGHVQSGTNLPEVLLYSGVALAALAGLSVLLGWLVAGRALRPLRFITASAGAISAASLHERLGQIGSYQEFTELGQSLDDLFGRLEAAFESQRHFVANASHELRTPLSAERTLLQVALADPGASAPALRAACEKLLALNQHQERLIEALLTLAVSQRGVERWEVFDLADVAAKVVASRGQEAGRRGIQIKAELAAAPVTGDPSLAESLVANLTDNALRHNRDGGWITITTAATQAEPGAAISVSNSGTLVPPAEVGRLFQPFQQLGPQRTRRGGGHGLGLAIVAAIAGAHGATLDARARPEGGLDVEVGFPPVAGPGPGR